MTCCCLRWCPLIPLHLVCARLPRERHVLIHLLIHLALCPPLCLLLCLLLWPTHLPLHMGDQLPQRARGIRPALSPELPSPDDNLFVANSDDEGALGDEETLQKPEGSPGLPHVEVELPLPPCKKSKVIHLATGGVHIDVHFLQPFHTHSILRLTVALHCQGD